MWFTSRFTRRLVPSLRATHARRALFVGTATSHPTQRRRFAESRNSGLTALPHAREQTPRAEMEVSELVEWKTSRPALTTDKLHEVFARAARNGKRMTYRP